MKRKSHQTERHMEPDVIGELVNTIHKSVLHGTRPEEGSMIEARQLVAQWTVGGRTLFDSFTPDRTVVLAALVVALWKDHELLQLVRRHRTEELDELLRESSDAEAEAIASAWTTTELTAKQKHERKRLKRNRSFSRSIEYQFGGLLEGQVDWRRLLVPLLGPHGDERWLRESQTCLDDIFAGETVNMLKLEELFWMDRHRFAEALRNLHPRRLDYLAVTKTMDYLLNKEPRTKRKSKKSRPGRSPRRTWLYNKARRIRVLKGIEARITSLPVSGEIARAFLTVIEPHLPILGKK